MDPEDYWRPHQLESDASYFVAEVQRFRSMWQGTRTPRALDVGAGLGKAMKALDDQGFDTYGLEPSASFRDLAVSRGIAEDRIKLAALEDAEYDPQTFDFVTFGAVLEHLHDPAIAIERALGWLAAGGLVQLEVPSSRWLIARLLNGLYRAQGLDYVTNLSPMHPPYHLYEFTVKSFEEHSKRAGYEVAYHRYYAGETFLPSFADVAAQRLMDATRTGMQLEVWLRARGSSPQ